MTKSFPAANSAGLAPQVLAAALQQPPRLQLSFYDYGLILRRQLEDGSFTEYPVDPRQVADLLAAKAELATGLLPADTLYVWTSGLKRLTVGFRPAQRTAIYLEGSETPLQVPLPGLIMLRLTVADKAPRYGVYAVALKGKGKGKDTGRPTTLDVPLFHVPLPNIYAAGNICWGSVPRASSAMLASVDLAEDWSLLLGSVFTAHSTGGKSKQEGEDIRQQLIRLERRRARAYPTRDLVPVTAATTSGSLVSTRGGERATVNQPILTLRQAIQKATAEG